MFRRCLSLIVAWSLVLAGQAYALGNSQRSLLSQNASYQTFYVDPAGSDNNSGQTPGNAWQSIAHVVAQKFPAHTVILFKGGQTFSGSLAFAIANAPAGYISVGSYGAGQATISSGNSAEGYKSTNLPGMALGNIILTGGGNTSNTTAGISIVNSQTGNTKLTGPTIYNTIVSGYGGNGIEIKGTSGFSGFNGITIVGNTVHDCTGEVTAVSGFLEGTSGINIFAYSGFGGGQGGVSPAHTNFTISNNTIYNVNGIAGAGSWTGSGITYFQAQYGLVTGNLVHDFGANVNGGFGAGGIWGGDMDSVVVQNNEVYNGKHGVGGFDGGAFDMDEGTTNSVVQYNWGHDNSGYGVLFDSNVDGLVTQWGGNTARFNLLQNNEAEIFIAATGNMTAASYAYNNTLYPAPGANAVGRGGTSTAIVDLANNILYAARSGDTVISISTPSSISFTGNDYYAALGASAGALSFTWNGTTYTSFSAWQTATGQEKISGTNVGLTSNPQIYVPGGGFITGGYSPAQMMAYNLQSGSPMIGVGINVTTQFGINPGSTDFYGATISATSMSVGAAAGDFASFAASCTASSNFLSRITGFTKLDNVNYNSLLCSGAFASFDLLYVLAAPNSSAAALNLLGSSFSLTPNGGLTFTARQGYAGNGTSGFLNTGWISSTNGVNYTLASATHFAYALVDGKADTQALYGSLNVANSSETSSFPGTGGWYSDANDFTGLTAAGTTSKGMFLLDRSSGNLTENFNGGVVEGPFSIAPVALVDRSMYLLGYDNGTANQFSSNTLAAVGFGAGGQNDSAIAARINSFMQAYGINAY